MAEREKRRAEKKEGEARRENRGKARQREDTGRRGEGIICYSSAHVQMPQGKRSFLPATLQRRTLPPHRYRKQLVPQTGTCMLDILCRAIRITTLGDVRSEFNWN